ncbi:MAG: hypothetical protein ACJAXS_002826 [Colwellia sp.]|jgi:hypothetical protein
MNVSSSGQSLVINQNKNVGNGNRFALESGNNFPDENNKSDTVQISEAGRNKMIHEIKSGEFIDFTAENGPYKKGLIFGLGSSAVNEWSAKGLDISKEAVISAGKAFQEGFTQLSKEYGDSLGGKGGISVNKHQVVINTQEVPDWFKQEYDSALSSMDNKDMIKAFEEGELFFISKPSSSSVNALASYASVEKAYNKPFKQDF